MGVQHIPGCCWVQYFRMADQTAEKMAELSIGEVYTSDKTGSDESGDGSETKPYKTALFSMHKHGKEPFPTIMVDAKEDGKGAELPESVSSSTDLVPCLERLDSHLSDNSYLLGHVATQADTVAHECGGGKKPLKYNPARSLPHFTRWCKHIDTFTANELANFPSTDLSILTKFRLPTEGSVKKYEPIAKSQMKKLT